MIIDIDQLPDGWYRKTQVFLDGVEVKAWVYVDTEAGLVKTIAMLDGKRYLYPAGGSELLEFLRSFPDAEPRPGGEPGRAVACRSLRGQAARFEPEWSGRYNGPPRPVVEMELEGYVYWGGYPAPPPHSGDLV